MAVIINQNKIDKDLENEIEQFAKDFVKQGNYPNKLSPIEVKIYSLPKRDVL